MTYVELTIFGILAATFWMVGSIGLGTIIGRMIHDNR